MEEQPKTSGAVAGIAGSADVPEPAETTGIVRHYLPSLALLDAYDTGRLSEPEGDAPTWELTYDGALSLVRGLPFYEGSELFGRERDGQLAGIVGTLSQGFGGQDLYPTVQDKAANLLYLVVKDHPFFDGNKRCAAALFVHFLDKNGILRRGDHLLVEGNALVAITLMVALSDPSDKDTVVTLVKNLIA